FEPFKQIKIMINDIALDKEVNIDETVDYGIWKKIFIDLKKLHNKVFDINTTMNLLFSATSIISSDLELVNSIHVVFTIVQKRIKNSMCALFVPDESGQLKVFAKNGLLNNNLTFISQDNNNYIWKTYSETKEFVINTSDKILKENLGNLCNEYIGSFMTIPLIDENKKCIGVFVIVGKLENSFNDDNTDIINSVSKYLVALINKIKDYQKIKETNRTLEIEVETASKELMETNNILIKKTKEIKCISDIALYASAKTNIDDCMEYISLKVKEILDVEKFGIFIYNEEKNNLISVKNSFDLKESLKISNKKGTIYNNILNNGENIILNNDSDLSNYSKNFISDSVKLKSAVFLPVKNENKVTAVVVAINKINSDFDFLDVRILEHISVIIYGIIDKMKFYNKLKFNNMEMGEANGNG
ncbi:MAG: GAF domain-containing protein, partial [Endomicrobiaceae bacterium]|nr:GAF domain-containing protein [Endomicrobiaceae bacterium]